MPEPASWIRPIRHGIVDSTNERALAAIAADDARHGDLHLAEGQSAGRGRRGRAWLSAPGEGVYATLVLRPAPPPIAPPALTMAGGLAALAAVRASGVVAARLEWPNDVVVGGRKIAGVLVESRGVDPRAPHAAVGVGIDVRQRAFPPELARERAVTSLLLEGADVTVERVEAELLLGLDRWLGGARLARVRGDAAATVSAWLDATGLAGREVVAESGGGAVRGELVALGLAEGARIRDAWGEERSIALEHLADLAPAGAAP